MTKDQAKSQDKDKPKSIKDRLRGQFKNMTKQMLREIRVNSKEELAERIHLYFDEVNAESVVFHWKYKLDDIDVSEEIITDTLPLKQSS